MTRRTKVGVFVVLALLIAINVSAVDSTLADPGICPQISINSATEAVQQARCYFRVVSEICVGVTSFDEVASLEQGLWTVVSKPIGGKNCSTWVVTFRAVDGELVTLASK